jgi:hypothetical protein
MPGAGADHARCTDASSTSSSWEGLGGAGQPRVDYSGATPNKIMDKVGSAPAVAMMASAPRRNSRAATIFQALQ